MPSKRPFTPAWLADAPDALAFLPGGYGRPADRAAAVQAAATRKTHEAVIDTLVATTPAQQAHRDALARAGTTAVVTGQQAGLFGGPLYTLYKAAAAIVDARALHRETGTPCVPVFWLQNEDHDFAEIASCAILGTDGALHPVSVPDDPDHRDRSISARRLGPEVVVALDTVEQKLSGMSEATATLALLRRCFTPERSPDAAFREWIEALFAPYGLLVVDPCRLREAALPVHRRAIDDAERISDALLRRSAALEDAGFAVQVRIRPGSPLSFHHPDGPDGPRRRFDGQPPSAGGTFSTSALLRPILQDTLLPTAAYVGGPGEIAYFAQLPPLYAAFDLPTPLVVPRARFRVVDETAARLLAQLELSADALSSPREDLLAGLVRPSEHPDPDTLAAAWADPLREALARFGPLATALDPTLGKATEKTSATITEALGRLIDRYRRSLAQSDGVAVERLDRLRTRLQPDGAPQERVHSWPWFAARYGSERFVETVVDAVQPFHGDLVELRP